MRLYMCDTTMMKGVYVATTHMHLECQLNYVERQMDPLSRELAGILPHDAYDSHQNASGKTVHEDLEERNFKKLAMCWQIYTVKGADDHGVTAEYVENASWSVDIDEHSCVNLCSRL